MCACACEAAQHQVEALSPIWWTIQREQTLSLPIYAHTQTGWQLGTHRPKDNHSCMHTWRHNPATAEHFLVVEYFVFYYFNNRSFTFFCASFSPQFLYLNDSNCLYVHMCAAVECLLLLFWQRWQVRAITSKPVWAASLMHSYSVLNLIEIFSTDLLLRFFGFVLFFSV